MNTDLVAKSLCFHGQPLQKIWEGERGNHDLYKLGLTNPDFTIYTSRQKGLTFQDRAKRLKLHQFIAKKAPILFDSGLVEENVTNKKKEKSATGTSIVMPPYESLLNKNIDKSKHIHHVLGAIQPGDIIYGTIVSRSSSGLLVKVLCTGEPIIRYLADVNIKAYVLAQNMVPAHDKKGNPKQFITNDYVCCEVMDISADADRMTLGMKGTLTIDAKAPLGLITSDQLPEYYKRIIENQETSYEELLEKSKGFENPGCVDNLFQELNLNPKDTFSNMSSLKCRFPQNEYASELRQVQASKWAFRSVADGIEHFKVGRHSEAFQCLNKALNIDPRNVEGLVARGALYANSGSFKKAVEDFETALKLNPYHANARKYMGETLVALGRSYEEENRIEEARKAYTDCLNIIPHHEEAKSSLEFLNGKSGQSKQLIDTNELLPALKLGGEGKKGASPSKKHEEVKKEKIVKKKKQKGGRKRKGSSSSSSSNNSSESSDSSSSDSSSSSASDSSSSDSEASHKRKRKSRPSKRQKSLSPLSKRMALMDEQHPASGTTRYQFNQPFHLANTASNAGDDYDAKVRNFLEMTRDEDDYESRVRKLVEEASKHRKEQKGSDEKNKKKDKKKQKKVKKESKKDKKKKDKSKEKIDLEGIDNMELKEALKIFKSLPMLDIGTKLSADLEKYEKNIEVLKGRDGPSTSRVSELEKYKKEKRPPTPPVEPPKPVPPKPRTPEPVKVLPPKPPIVLDKFGCFRLAAPEETKIEPSMRRSPSPRHRYSRSRSRSRYRRRSRSPRRSRSIRRSRSLQRSRSIRRSRSPRRSRSRSFRRSRSLRRSRSVRRSRSNRRSRSRSSRRSYSRRRSISRRRRSRSRSVHRRTPSPFVRRSRSFESGGRRWKSRSRSRSFSRSRSRSPRVWRRGRRGNGPPFRGSRGFGFRGRGRGRGRGGGFRGRRSPFRRDGSFESSPRDTRRDEDNFPRNRRRSPEVGIEGKWTHDKYEKTGKNNTEQDNGDRNKGSGGEENWDDDIKTTKGPEPSVEEIDKIINQAQRERKEEIIQRDKNLLKKPTPTNLPF